LDDPPEHGSIVHSDRSVVEVVFPAAFAGASLGTHAHPEGHDIFHNARWVLLKLDGTAAHEHYRDMVMQKVMLALITVICGISALFFVGVVQKYTLACASIEKLETIKHQLARFVPGTVQRLIEANPDTPHLDKVERDATILFLDIEQYTRLAEAMPPDALNRLIERYFSAFLDAILTYGGEINETAGDGLMAIFTATNPRTHAVNATRAAVTIRQQAEQLHTVKAPQEPTILVNMGLCTGPVLLGATRITSVKQERLTYTASGMVTNIAARLCELATHGEIYLSEITAHLVRHAFARQEPTYKHLKNLSTEVKVYKLL
jgi:class 3 adenylate cyclase